jgi:AraC family transcriptional regulator
MSEKAYEIEVKQAEPQHVLCIRETTTQEALGSTLGRLFGAVREHLEELDVEPQGPPFARYPKFEEDDVEVEAGFPVPGPLAETDEITNDELQGGQLASTWHVGPYETLYKAHAALEAWIEEQNRAPAGAPWEIYWTDPEEVPEPDQWKTEVVWPVYSIE